MNEWTTINCEHPNDLVDVIAGANNLKPIYGYDKALVSRYLLQFLLENGAEVLPVEDRSNSTTEYRVILPGGAIQIRIKRALLDSVRDWVMLFVLVAMVLNSGGKLSEAAFAAAIATFVRSALSNTYKLNEQSGERCVVKLIMRLVRDSKMNGPFEGDAIASKSQAGACLLADCQYRTDASCAMTREELGKILMQLVSDNVVTKRRADSYKLPL